MIRASILGFVVLLLGLSACGGGSGTPSTPSSSTTSSPSASSLSSADSSIKAVASPGSSSGNAGPSVLAIATSVLANSHVGSHVSDALAASGGTPPYSWRVASGKLPAGIVVSAAGVLNGTPTAAGTGTLGLALTDSSKPAKSAARSYSWSILPATLAVATTTLPAAGTNTPYSATLTASGGLPPYVWTVTGGALPAGLSLGASGVMAGTPTQAIAATIQVTVTDSNTPAQTASQSLQLVVAVAPLAISHVALTAAIENVAWKNFLHALGGVGAYTWSLQAGTLPEGITLGSSGVLSGTPTASGIATFVVKITDGASPANGASKTYNIVVEATGTPVEVTLAAAPSSLTIGSSFAGLSYEKFTLSSALFGPNDATLIAMFQRLGSGLLRIGGNSVDHTLWNATGPGETPNQVAPPDVARLAGFLQASHWRVLYGIEFLNEAASPVAPTDPALVAAEAVYVMQTLGDSLYAFEIGNEPDLYIREMPTFTYADFQSQWQVYRSAILSAVAAAKAAGTLPQSANPVFTGPATTYNDAGYTTPFAAAEAQNITLLTRHHYIADGLAPTSTMALMLAPDPNLAPILSFMKTTAASANIPSGYRISEANSFYDGGAPGISDAFGSSLWAINFLFNNAWAGATGVNFHGGGNSPGYTPIADNGSAVVAVRPEYYGIYLFSQAANGALLATTTTPATSSLYAYAVAATGATEVMLVNTSATVANNVSIQFDTSRSQASFVTLTGPSLGSTTGQLLGGAVIAANGNWTPIAPPSLPIFSGLLEVPVPAGSAILITAQ